MLGKLSRRMFFGAIPGAALGAKAAAEAAAMKLANIQDDRFITEKHYIDVPGNIGGPTNPVYNHIESIEKRKLWRLLENEGFAKEYESLVYEANKVVYSIDYDIASKRSFSLAAKITFQRQRNVQRALEYAKSERYNSWDLAQNLITKYLGINFQNWWNENAKRDEGQASPNPR